MHLAHSLRLITHWPGLPWIVFLWLVPDLIREADLRRGLGMRFDGTHWLAAGVNALVAAMVLGFVLPEILHPAHELSRLVAAAVWVLLVSRIVEPLIASFGHDVERRRLLRRSRRMPQTPPAPQEPSFREAG